MTTAFPPEHGAASGPGRGRRRPARAAVFVALVVLAAAVGLGVVLTSGPTAQTASSRRPGGTHAGAQKGVGGTTTTAPVVEPSSAGQSWAPGSSGLAPSIPPSAVPDQSLDALFSSQLGPGWVGGDATYSTKLPDGRESFVFSDTLIGTAKPDGTATITGMANSSELVGVLPQLATDYVGSYDLPSSLIPDTNPKPAEWNAFATYTQGQDQMIFLSEFSGPNGILTLSYTGRSAIAVMSLQGGHMPTFNSIVSLPADLTTEWGQATVQSGGYLFVYGTTHDPEHQTVEGMKVARVPVVDSLDVAAWQYWNGSNWVPDETSAVVVPTVNLLTGVTPNPDGTGYIGVSIPDGVFNDTTVDLSYAEAPQGPWTAPAPVYTIPDLRQYPGEIAYSPTFHPELSPNASDLVVSYDIDTTVGFPVLLKNVHSYQPRFLLVSG